MQHSAPARTWVGDNGKIIEPLFADYFLSLHPMRCFQGRLFTVDGMIEDEAPLAISLRSAYNLCNSTTEFRVLRVGGSIRIPKDSFDAWLRAA